LTNTLVLSILWAGWIYSDTMLYFLIDKIPFVDIYSTGKTLHVAGFLGQIPFLAIRNLNSRMQYTIVFGALILTSLLLHFSIMQESQESASSGYITIALLFTLKTTTSLLVTVCFLSVVRVTPVLMVATSLSIVNIISRTFAVLSPYAAQYLEEPIITITYASLLAIITA